METNVEGNFYKGKLLTLDSTSSDEYVKEVYDEWAKTYDKETREAGYVAYKRCTPVFDQLLRENFGEKRKNMKILDAAAGTGIVGKVLQDAGYTNIHALDISQKMLDEAEKLNIYKKFICAPLSADPIVDISNGEYDALICVGAVAIGHVKPVAFDEILRLVKPGGIIGFTLRKDVYEETVRHEIHQGTQNFGFRKKMDELEKQKKWKLLKCDLIDYHTAMSELLAKCYSLMYRVL